MYAVTPHRRKCLILGGKVFLDKKGEYRLTEEVSEAKREPEPQTGSQIKAPQMKCTVLLISPVECGHGASDTRGRHG